MLAQLSATSAAQVVAALREPLSRQIASEIAPQCSRAVAGHYPLARAGTEEISREEFTRTFGAGGLIDGFFQRHLMPYVDTSTRPWTYRGVDAAARAEASESLLQFQRAQAIRDAFFRDGGRRLGVRLDFRLIELDPGISEFALDVDGQLLRFRPGSQAVQSVQWPGPNDAGRVHLQITPSSGAGGPGYVFQGPWALFRLLDRVRTEPGSAPDRSRLVFDVEGRKARFEVKSPAALNPIARQELEQFQCPKRL
jgi:type VI secretion system protein ImpL